MASENDLRALAIRFQGLLEEERTRLAQELHDNLTQKLTVVSLELSLLDGSLASEQELPRARLRIRIKELSAIVADLIYSLRRIKAELRPKVLDEFGLVAALEWEGLEFGKKTGVPCNVCAVGDDTPLPPQMATELYRMFQQILANVADHAAARHVAVQVRQDPQTVEVQVSDDGRGITLEESASPSALGLLELRERARALGGSFEITGCAGKGTTVKIQVPLTPAISASEPGVAQS